MAFHPSRSATCDCAFRGSAPDHHDQLLAMESWSFEQTTAFVEMAVTWGEVEHDIDALIDPDDWLDFVDSHEWDDAETVTSMVLALVSIVRRPVRPHGLASVTPLRLVADDPVDFDGVPGRHPSRNALG